MPVKRGIKKVTLEFSDGTVSTHYPDEQDGFLQEFNTHREDPAIKGRIVEFWRSFSVGWREGTVSRD